MDIQIKTLAEGITLYMLPDEKFKNCVQGIYFNMPLKKETATALALLPRLLTAGNTKYPGRSKITLKTEELYGTRVQCGTEKQGEAQVISFVGDAICDRYAGEALYGEVQSLLKTIILEPKTENEGFSEEVFKREKESLREDIKSIINDKRRLALIRCSEEMCKGEPYGIRADGTEEDLDALSPKGVYALYQEMLKTAKVDIFVTGAFDKAVAEKAAEEFAAILGGRQAAYPETTRNKARAVRYVEDKENVQQGKLVIGYRTDVDPKSDDYYALMVYNAVFGGGTASKLFNNVREKMSLCYYASSGLEKAKGLLFVQSGIEFSKYNVALEAIGAQADEIRAGNISDAEFYGSVQGIINQLRSYKDSPGLILQYYRRQLPFGALCDMETVIEKIGAVTPADVKRIAEKVHMDTVYFLNGTGGDSI